MRKQMWNMLSCWKRNRLLLWHIWDILFCLLILCQSFDVSFQDSQSFLSSPTNPSTNLLQQPKSAHRTINKVYLWPRSKCWIGALQASIQHAATKVTNIPYLSFCGRQLLRRLRRQITIYANNCSWVCNALTSKSANAFVTCSADSSL